MTLYIFKLQIAKALIMSKKCPNRGTPSSSDVSSKAKRTTLIRNPINDIQYGNIGLFPKHVIQKQKC